MEKKFKKIYFLTNLLKIDPLKSNLQQIMKLQNIFFPFSYFFSTKLMLMLLNHVVVLEWGESVGFQIEIGRKYIYNNNNY